MPERTEFPSLYPCDFPVKVIGIPGADFEAGVLAVFRTHAGEVDAGAVGRRMSRGGKYVSLTVRIVARSREHLETVYAELKNKRGVIMVL